MPRQELMTKVGIRCLKLFGLGLLTQVRAYRFLFPSPGIFPSWRSFMLFEQSC